MATGDKALIDLARKRFQQAEEAEDDQRDREREDLRFAALDQWDDTIRAARSAQGPGPNGQPAVPARPCLTIDRIGPAINQITNQQRQADLGIHIIPADDFTGLTGPVDHEEIELREGLVRRIQRESNASDAWLWAGDRAVKAGRGYVGIMTRYLPGRTFDQEIYIQRFYNQFSVLLDPTHEQPDGSDAEWAFVGVDLPWHEYQRQFPRNAAGGPNQVADATGEGEWRALGDDAPNWFQGEGETRSVRVVDYWYMESESDEIALLPTGEIVPVRAVPEGVTPLETRTAVTKRVKWVKLDGVQVLDRTDWPGKYIPIVKVLGHELQPYDDERRAQGIVRPNRDSQRGFNYMVSRQVEAVGLTPLPPFMVAEGQIEGYEEWYQNANTRTLPYLPYRTRDLEGNPVGAPQRANADTPIQAIAASVQMFNEAIQAGTGQPDPSLGRVDPAVRSGKAVRALVEQAQRGNSSFLDNLAKSMRYGALIINDLLPHIYNRPGRLARLMQGNGDVSTVLLHQPFTVQGTGPGAIPQQVPPGTPNAKIYRLTPDADWNVTVKITKAYDTRRQEEAAIVGELIQSAPELMTWFGDLFFANTDGPGHQDMADRAKVMLAPPIQQLLRGGQTLPPEAQQQISQATQMIQALTQQLTAAQEIIQQKQVEMQAKIEEAKIEAASRERVAMISASAQLAKVEADIDAMGSKAFIDALQERINKEFDGRMKQIEEGLKHVYRQDQQAAQHAHEKELKAVEVGADLAKARLQADMARTAAQQKGAEDDD